MTEEKHVEEKVERKIEITGDSGTSGTQSSQEEQGDKAQPKSPEDKPENHKE